MLGLLSSLLLQKPEGAMAQKYLVTLMDDERAQWLALTKRGKVAACRLTRAHLWLQAETGLSDESMAQALPIGPATVERIRQRFVEEGLEAALTERPRPGGPRTWDGKQEAFLIARACSTPPAGRRCWTRPLRAHRRVALRIVDAISDETGRRTLKQTRCSQG
jgi:putative transposase